ncbi:MAG: helix-turn-helix domain-containing protein [Acidobacteriota bacterium]
MPNSEDSVSLSSPLNDLLRSAREKMGWSRREFASRVGVAWATVSAAEKGSDPRHSTLMRYVSSLPGLRADDLLAGKTDQVRPPAASKAVWAYMRDVHGYSIETARIVMDWRAGGATGLRVELRGLRLVEGDLNDPDQALFTLRAICLGSNAVVRELMPPEGPLAGQQLVVEDGALTHEFSFPENDDQGLDYTCTWNADSSEEASPEPLQPPLSVEGAAELVFPVLHPIEELTLEVRCGDDLPREAVPHLWPATLAWQAGEQDLSRYLHPKGLGVERDEGQGIVRVTIPQPVVGLACRLLWPTDDSFPDSCTPLTGSSPGFSGEESLGDSLRAAREQAGLSCRQLATRMDVSHATILAIERGRDARASTLARYLEALPSLTAQDLLPAEGPEGPISRDEVWRHYRDLFRIEASCIRKTAEVLANGDCETIHETTDLRDLSGRQQDLTILAGLQRTVYMGSPSVLREIETEAASEEESLRTRVIRRRDGRQIQQFTIPAAVSSKGLSYVRRLVSKGVFATLGTERRNPEWDDLPIYEGCTVTVPFPVRQLEIEVRFPEGAWPKEVYFRAVHGLSQSVPDAQDQLATIHEGRFETPMDRDAGRIRLVVQEPLCTLKYVIGWRLPVEVCDSGAPCSSPNSGRADESSKPPE